MAEVTPAAPVTSPVAPVTPPAAPVAPPTTTETPTLVGGAPETPTLAGTVIDYNWQLPEGIEIDKNVLSKFEGLAKGLNLKQEQAQPLLNLWVEAVQGYENEAVEEWKDQRKEWQSEIKADADIGGARFAESLGLANKGLSYAGDSFIKAFGKDGNGILDHPEMFKFLMKVGKSLSEDRVGHQPLQAGVPDKTSELPDEMKTLVARYPAQARQMGLIK